MCLFKDILPARRLFSCFLLQLFLSVILIFTYPKVCFSLDAQAISASPSFNFTSVNLQEHTFYVTGKVHTLVEIEIESQISGMVYNLPQDQEVVLSNFRLRANEPVIITLNGVENLIPDQETNSDKGITVPEEAIDSKIEVMYAISPISTEYLSPEDLNNKSISIPYSEESRIFQIKQKARIKDWAFETKEGTYPFIWYEDPDGFNITVTIKP